MASRDRERRLARERYERMQQRRMESAQQRRRRNQVIASVVAVVLVVGTLVGLALRGGGDSDVVTVEPGSAATTVPSTEPSPLSTTDPSGAPTTAVAPCPEAAPAANPSPASFSKPEDQKLAAGTTYVATIATNCGMVTVTLDAAKAPQTVNSFVYLARQGFFDKTPCHRLTTEGIYVLQCGDPTGQGTGSPGYSIPLENAPQDGVYPAGTLAMARGDDPDSGGSQFFLVYKDSALPSPGYSIFGTIGDGLDVLTAEAAAGVDGGLTDGAPARAIGLTTVTITEQKA